jgi:putative ATP-binding cassette transporter
LTQAGGLDSERDWGTILSLHEQQLLAVAHILLLSPRFALLEGVGAALGSDQVHTILRLLSERSIAYINQSETDDTCELYDAALECREDGSWTWIANRVGTAPRRTCVRTRSAAVQSYKLRRLEAAT